MDKTKLFAIVGLVAALLLALYGQRQAEPDAVETTYLEQVGFAKKRGLEQEGFNAALKELQRYAEFSLDQDYEEGAAKDKALLELELLTKDNAEFGAKLRRQGKGKELEQNSLKYLAGFVEERMSQRALLYRVLSFTLAFFSLLTLVLSFMKLRQRTKDKMIKNLIVATAMTSILVLALIMIFLFIEGLPIFDEVSLSDFIFGDGWYPTDEDEPEFGIFPLIIGSLCVTGLSSLIAIPLGVMTALYLAEIATPRIRGVVKPMIELLASLPSVVIGFFGMVVVAPFLQNTFGIANGLNMFNASIMLAFMSVPTITSVSEDAIFAVPRELHEASLALGATRMETIWKVVIPASLSGISTAVILGMSRAIGETMVVLMVAGGAALVPDSIFDPVRPMPASIAAEMGEAALGSPHYYSLFAIGIVLFMFTMLFNIVADHIAHKYKQVGAATL